MTEIGECHCGCGQKTRPARRTNTERGWVKGQPLRYVAGHNAWGKGESMGGPPAYINPRPFLAWLSDDMDLSDNDKHVIRRAKKSGRITLRVVDQICVHLGRPDIPSRLYPLDGKPVMPRGVEKVEPAEPSGRRARAHNTRKMRAAA